MSRYREKSVQMWVALWEHQIFAAHATDQPVHPCRLVNIGWMCWEAKNPVIICPENHREQICSPILHNTYLKALPRIRWSDYSSRLMFQSFFIESCIMGTCQNIFSRKTLLVLGYLEDLFYCCATHVIVGLLKDL